MLTSTPCKVKLCKSTVKHRDKNSKKRSLPPQPNENTKKLFEYIYWGDKCQPLLEKIFRTGRKKPDQPLTPFTDNENRENYCRTIFSSLAQINLK